MLKHGSHLTISLLDLSAREIAVNHNMHRAMKSAMKRPAASELPGVVPSTRMKPMKRAKKSHVGDGDNADAPIGNATLTAAAIEARGLNEKIDLLKKGNVAGDIFMKSLKRTETPAGWKRFEFGHGKSSEATRGWDDMKTLGRGENKDQKKDVAHRVLEGGHLW